MLNLQDLLSLVLLVLVKKGSSKGMAVPKSRRSKSKGRTRLSNWKKKGNKTAKKAFNEAKRVFAQEKQSETLIKKDGEVSE